MAAVWPSFSGRIVLCNAGAALMWVLFLVIWVMAVLVTLRASGPHWLTYLAIGALWFLYGAMNLARGVYWLVAYAHDTVSPAPLPARLAPWLRTSRTLRASTSVLNGFSR